MKLWALINFYDEHHDRLGELVESVAPFVDGIIALDGRYPTFDGERDRSPERQHEKLEAMRGRCGLDGIVTWTEPISEVDKRSMLFSIAMGYAQPMVDWFLIMDADTIVTGQRTLRRGLTMTDRHVGEILCRQGDTWFAYRALFRAIPGLRVAGKHTRYEVPEPNALGRRVCLYGDADQEPAADLTHELTISHRQDPERNRRRQRYYTERDAAGIES